MSVTEFRQCSKKHFKDFLNSPKKIIISDVYSIGRNLKEKHSLRVAGVMGLSGITMPLKAYLETSGKGINSMVYNGSPEFLQKGFDILGSSLPESMSWLVNFSTAGEEMSDLNSILSRAQSLALSYVVASVAIKGREFALKELDVRKGGKLREMGKLSFDFGSAITLGSGLDYIRYGISQALTNSIDVANRTNATLAVAMPTAVLHMFRGWFLDVGGDLIGYKESERTPKFIANKSQKFKKNLFWGLTMGAFAGSSLVYYYNDAPFFQSQGNQIVETVEENSERGLGKNCLEYKVDFEELGFRD